MHPPPQHLWSQVGLAEELGLLPAAGRPQFSQLLFSGNETQTSFSNASRREVPSACLEPQQPKHHVCCPRAPGRAALLPGPGQCPAASGSQTPPRAQPAEEACAGEASRGPGAPLGPQPQEARPPMAGGGQVTSPEHGWDVCSGFWVPCPHVRDGPRT